jgi:hypothetical protein
MEYSYHELKEDLSIGHELHFYYGKEKYSISYNHEGWYLTQYGNEEDQAFMNSEELLEKATIDNKSLEEIWKDIIIDVIF